MNQMGAYSSKLMPNLLLSRVGVCQFSWNLNWSYSGKEEYTCRDHFYPMLTFTSVSKTIYKQQIFVVSYKYSKTNNSITGSRSTAVSSIWQQDHFYRYVWQILFCMFGKYYFVCLANIILYVWQILFFLFCTFVQYQSISLGIFGKFYVLHLARRI